jgi:hypothetical protein
MPYDEAPHIKETRMKKTVLTIILTALVTDHAVTRLHNHQAKARNAKRRATQKREDDIFAIRRASNVIARREAHGEYNASPEKMLEDYEFEIIVAHLK